MEYKQLQMYPTKPMIYYVKWSNEYKNYFLEPYQNEFKLPPKIYGNANKIAYRVWNDYIINDRSTGILLSGAAGGGKSLVISIISNLALKNKMAVIMLQKVRIDNNLVHWLSTLTNVVLYLDEFGKMISRTDQDQMLTMFTDVNGSKKIYLLTENRLSYVSEFILNRPGRVRYHVNFDKIDKDTLDQYCTDHNVAPEFFNDLERKYKISSTFTFDHLQCIISEHEKYPHEKFKDLIEWLNLDIFKQKEEYRIRSFKVLENPDLEIVYRQGGDPYTPQNLDTKPGRTNCAVIFNGVRMPDGKVEPLTAHFSKYRGEEWWWFSFNDPIIFNDDGSVTVKTDQFELVLELKPESETMWRGF